VNGWIQWLYGCNESGVNVMKPFPAIVNTYGEKAAIFLKFNIVIFVRKMPKSPIF
jgi:hypothetical protein